MATREKRRLQLASKIGIAWAAITAGCVCGGRYIVDGQVIGECGPKLGAQASMSSKPSGGKGSGLKQPSKTQSCD